MEKPVDNAKIRIVKAGQKRARAGMIRIVDEKGRGFYRGVCDTCGQVLTLRQPPDQGEDLLCRDCRFVRTRAKPSTRVLRGKGRFRYITECDRCGQPQKTPFLPRKEFPFSCDACHRAEPRPAVRKPIKKNVEVVAEGPEPRYRVPCDLCGAKVALRFAPGPNEDFICPACFDRKQVEKEKRDKKPATKILFNLECSVCGKQEMVDFVPRSLTDALCGDCFKSRTRRR